MDHPMTADWHRFLVSGYPSLLLIIHSLHVCCAYRTASFKKTKALWLQPISCFLTGFSGSLTADFLLQRKPGVWDVEVIGCYMICWVIANYFLTKGAVEFFVSNPFIRILETVDTTRAIISRSDLAVSYGLGFFAALVVGTLSGCMGSVYIHHDRLSQKQSFESLRRSLGRAMLVALSLLLVIHHDPPLKIFKFLVPTNTFATVILANAMAEITLF
eukprot:TRINITY_DN2203_c0_g1_i1.p1 TRINITY_DN2203_c0_g1~~TRINITY_DN2203_c0_g1_i1.p1  ORF type:complete len:216 (+),score=45.74 TRINITY_DN2203_c0_g1_i1:56-703(+)